jgi:hypothetical protein
MNCSRCRADLPDTATFCPRCGATTPQMQPVGGGSSAASYNLPNTFSYLPAGAPPWPTTIPQRSVYASPAVSQPKEVSAVKPTRSKTTMRGVLVALAVVILVPLIGSLVTLTSLYINGDLAPKKSAASQSPRLTASVTATPSQVPGTQGQRLPNPGSFKESRNPDLNLSLQYPSDWQATGPQKTKDSSVSLSVTTPQQQEFGIIVLLTRLSDQATAQYRNADELNQDVIYTLTSEQGGNPEVVQPGNTSPQIGGTTWSEMDATYSLQQGKAHLASFSVKRNNVYYNIVILTADVVYEEAVDKYINRILKSIRFLN